MADTPMGVVVVDGQVTPHATTSPQEMLAGAASCGTYTTALVVNDYEVIDWPLHLQRLCRCAGLGANTSPGTSGTPGIDPVSSAPLALQGRGAPAC